MSGAEEVTKLLNQRHLSIRTSIIERNLTPTIEPVEKFFFNDSNSGEFKESLDIIFSEIEDKLDFT